MKSGSGSSVRAFAGRFLIALVVGTLIMGAAVLTAAPPLRPGQAERPRALLPKKAK